jgi:hypothetical protein
LGWLHVLNPTHSIVQDGASNPGGIAARHPLQGAGAVWPFAQNDNARPNQYDVIDDITKFIGNNESKMSDQNNPDLPWR